MDTGWTVVTNLPQVDHGLPPAVLATGDHGLLLTPEVTVTVTDFALAEITAYVEIESQGGWWAPGLVDNGKSVYGDDDQPLAATVGLPGGFGYVSLGGGIRTGITLDTTGVFPFGRGAHAGEAMALSQVLSTAGNLIALPAGIHNLALGVATDINAGSLAPGNPNVVTRNAILAVRVLAATATVAAPPPTVPADTRIITRGDTYTGSRALTATSTDWPVLTGAAVRYEGPMGDRTVNVACTVTGAHTVSLELTDLATLAMAPALYAGQLHATLADGTVTTLGALNLDAR